MYLKNNFIKTSCSHDINKWHPATMNEGYHNFSFTQQNGALCRENTQPEVKNCLVSKALIAHMCLLT